jgi:hypothetical protein
MPGTSQANMLAYYESILVRPTVGNEWLERYGLRAFIVYAILRTAGGMVWSTKQLSCATPLLYWLDFAILAIPLLILFMSIWNELAEIAPCEVCLHDEYD